MRRVLFVMLLMTVSAGFATEIKPPKTVNNGEVSFVVSKTWQILYFKKDDNQIFKVLNCVRGQAQNKRFVMAAGKVVSQSCNLKNGLFTMHRKVNLTGSSIEADLKVSVTESGKTDFSLKLDYKSDVTWNANHRRMNNMMVMQTDSPLAFRAIKADGSNVSGTTKGKVVHNYLREVTIETTSGPFVIKAENKETSIRLASPENIGAKFAGAYIVAGLSSKKDKGKSVSFEKGDTEELTFSITPGSPEKQPQAAAE